MSMGVRCVIGILHWDSNRKVINIIKLSFFVVKLEVDIYTLCVFYV
jgi:hypothetical protein